MAEYRRFLSYVYSYPNGKKEQNTGFVKIEARGRDWTCMDLCVRAESFRGFFLEEFRQNGEARKG